MADVSKPKKEVAGNSPRQGRSGVASLAMAARRFGHALRLAEDKLKNDTEK